MLNKLAGMQVLLACALYMSTLTLALPPVVIIGLAPDTMRTWQGMEPVRRLIEREEGTA